ncbi:hypothetical protein ACTWP5_06380 [Streptomyces sp. 4N509B]|uniref:hypothetical protein n=1 Tax=Streptomyces sp. 4N509B TaxID=3457413 RepID=UPI003FD5808F
MHGNVRPARVCGAGLAAAGLLVAGAPAADATDTRPKPPPVNLLSATVEGCQAPCATDERGEVTITFERPVRPDDIPPAFVHIRVTADGVGVHHSMSNSTGDPWVYTFRICATEDLGLSGCSYPYQIEELRGDEEFAVSVGYSWDCDPFLPECAGTSQMSDPSNALVPTQL